MKNYAQYFLKIKVESTKHYTDEECNEINNSHKELGCNFQIEIELKQIMVLNDEPIFNNCLIKTVKNKDNNVKNENVKDINISNEFILDLNIIKYVTDLGVDFFHFNSFLYLYDEEFNYSKDIKDELIKKLNIHEFIQLKKLNSDLLSSIIRTNDLSIIGKLKINRLFIKECYFNNPHLILYNIVDNMYITPFFINYNEYLESNKFYLLNIDKFVDKFNIFYELILLNINFINNKVKDKCLYYLYDIIYDNINIKKINIFDKNSYIIKLLLLFVHYDIYI